MTSQKVGYLKVGEEIEVFSTEDWGCTVRVELDRGWASVTGSEPHNRGKTLLELVTSGAPESSDLSTQSEEGRHGEDGKEQVTAAGFTEIERIKAQLAVLELVDTSKGAHPEPEPEPAIAWPAGTLTVEVVSCSGLLVADMNGKSDPYVKVKLGKSSAQTGHKKKTLDPVFNEKLQPMAVGAGSAEDQGEAQVVSVEVWDHDSGPGNDDFLGEVDVSLLELCSQGLLEGQAEGHFAFGDANGRLGWSEKKQAKQRKAKGKHKREPQGSVDLKFRFVAVDQ